MLPPWVALGLLFTGVVPAIAFGIGGIPFTRRAGLASGGLTSLATVATKLVAGQPPYTPSFHGAIPFIYPPGTLPFIVPPLIAGADHYVLAFAIEMLAILLVGVALVRDYAASSGIRNRGLTWSAIGVLAAAGPLTFYRTDLAIGLLLLAAALAWRRLSLTTSFLLVLAAGLIKEYAWVELVPLVAWQVGSFLRQHSYTWSTVGRAVRPAALAAVPILAVLVGFEVWSGGGLVRSQLHNLDRGVEIESLPAAMAFLINGLKDVAVVRGTLGSIQITGPGLHLPIISGVFAAAGIAMLAAAAGRSARLPAMPGSAFSFALAVALVATPVLSPQYIDALTPCLCLAALECNGRFGPILLWSTVALALLTQLEYPYLWTSVVALAPHGLATLELRNLLLIGMVAAVGMIWIRGPGTAPPVAAGAR